MQVIIGNKNPQVISMGQVGPPGPTGLKGDHETQHTHQFDHLTLLAKGSIDVKNNGISTIFKAPHMIFISKDSVHSMTALEDDTVAYCIHSLTQHDGTSEYVKYVDDLVSDDMIPNGTKSV